MEKFEYRVPRFTTDLPARFIQENSVLAGRCHEISSQGLTLELEQTVEPDTRGMISLACQGRTLEIKAVVTRTDGNCSGFKFLYASEAERAAIAQLVSTLATPQKRSGPVLLNPTEH